VTCERPKIGGRVAGAVTGTLRRAVGVGPGTANTPGGAVQGAIEQIVFLDYMGVNPGWTVKASLANEVQGSPIASGTGKVRCLTWICVPGAFATKELLS